MKLRHMLGVIAIATLSGVGAAYIAHSTILLAQGKPEPQPVTFYMSDLPSFCQQQLSMRVYVYAGPPPAQAQTPIALWMCVR